MKPAFKKILFLFFLGLVFAVVIELLCHLFFGWFGLFCLVLCEFFHLV